MAAIHKVLNRVGDDDLADISSQQLRVLWALQHLHVHYGRATIREVGKLIGLNAPDTVYKHLVHLEAHGLAKRMKVRNNRGQMVTATPGWLPVHTLVAEGTR